MDATDSQPLIKCPNCTSTQITPKTKGFGLGKAAAGAILTGGIGLLAGFWGSGDIEVVCLNCGKTWNPKKTIQPNISVVLPKINQETKDINARIIHYYEKGDKETALKIHNENFPPKKHIDLIYAQAKTQSKKRHGGEGILIVIFIIIIGVVLIAAFS